MKKSLRVGKTNKTINKKNEIIVKVWSSNRDENM